MEKIFYAIGGAVTAAAVLLVAVFGVNGMRAPGAPLFAYQVRDAGDEAFGNLSVIPAVANVRPQSGGGGGNPAVSMTTDSKMMIYPGEFTRFKYVFEGELPALPGANVDVFRRDVSNLSVPFSSIASRFNMGTVDVDSFSSMRVESLQLVQDESFGYMINIGMREGAVNVSANWERWPQSNCQTEECFRRERMTLAQMLPDDQVISIAQAFVQDHGVDLSAYGEPVVDSAWRADYERMTNKDEAYLPEVQRVIFPLVVEGKTVYDQSGIPMGISIGVHAKHKRVFEAWGIMDRSYDQSSYAGVTDAAAITKFLENFENYPVDILASEGTTIKQATVKLGTPEISLVQFYRYENNRNDELLVPSFIFPVESVDGAQAPYRQAVVVPLAQEMLDQQQPIVMPMDAAVR
jgi:hypothetical protein